MRCWRYRWDGFDRLVGLETPDGARWRYSYDAFGRRVGKELVGSGRGTRRVDYVWQGISLAEAWHRKGDDDGQDRLSIERWHFEPDGLRPLAKELVPAGADAQPLTAEAEWLPIVADQLGAPHALFDEDGQCRWRAETQLWGRTRTARALMRERRDAGDAEDGGKTSPCALRFPGQWEDAESGLHYNLNRYYDPDTGQYLSPDPIGVDGGLRTHAYVHDPLRWIDPEGLARCTASTRDVITRGPKGQITSVKGTIHPSDIGTGTNTNASSRTWARSLGQATDDAGHSRGSNLGGSGGKDYVWPQNPHYNRGDFRDFESRIAGYVKKTNRPVNFEQIYQYDKGGTRPTGVKYDIFDEKGGKLFSRVFDN